MRPFGGIRNTCARCGQPLPGEIAWAESQGAAAAGQGICGQCYLGPLAMAQPDQAVLDLSETPVETAIGSTHSRALALDLSDGVDDAEARVAGQALRERRKRAKRAG